MVTNDDMVTGDNTVIDGDTVTGDDTVTGFDRSVSGSGVMVNKQAPGTLLYIATYK